MGEQDPDDVSEDNHAGLEAPDHGNAVEVVQERGGHMEVRAEAEQVPPERERVGKRLQRVLAVYHELGQVVGDVERHRDGHDGVDQPSRHRPRGGPPGATGTGGPAQHHRDQEQQGKRHERARQPRGVESGDRAAPREFQRVDAAQRQPGEGFRQPVEGVAAERKQHEQHAGPGQGRLAQEALARPAQGNPDAARPCGRVPAFSLHGFPQQR